MKSLLLMLLMATSFISCNGGVATVTTYGYYDPYIYNGYDCWDYYCDDGYYYYDPYDGYYYDVYVYEKLGGTPKDLNKAKAIAEAKEIKAKAEFLSDTYALSLERSKEVARLTTHWKRASLKGMTAAENDAFSTELLGFSIRKAQKELKTGKASLEDLVNSAARANDITPEHASKLMAQILGL